MSSMKGFHVSASGAIQGHHGPLVRLVQGRLHWVKYFKCQYELLPFGAFCNLKAKMHNTSKFWSVKFMDANCGAA